MWIPDYLQQQIKDRADIVEVVGHFVALKRTSSRYRALCPFHAERTPSFYVTPSKGIYKCFGCENGGDAIHFLMEHERMTYPEALVWLAVFYKIPLDTGGDVEPKRNLSRRRFDPQPAKPEILPSFVDDGIFRKSLAAFDRNNLITWLCQRINRELVLEAVKAYHIGTTQNGHTIFWQVNIEGKAGTGHVIAYPLNDHHRIRDIHPTWVHTLLKQTDESKFNWVKYWFGEHLLPLFPTHTVAIVESEKTALVASIYFRHMDIIWLASCGKDGLNNRDKWKILRGRKAVLYPDLSLPDDKGQTPFQQWNKIAAEMAFCGFDVSVNSFLESHADEFERSQKWDLADFLLRRDLQEFQSHFGTQSNISSQHEVLSVPIVRELIKRFDLKLDQIEPIANNNKIQ